MSFLGKTLGSLISPVLGLLGVFNHKKPVVQPGPATRDDAALVAAQDTALARRRGAAADMLTGTQGAEAGGGSVGRLIAGN